MIIYSYQIRTLASNPHHHFTQSITDSKLLFLSSLLKHHQAEDLYRKKTSFYKKSPPLINSSIQPPLTPTMFSRLCLTLLRPRPTPRPLHRRLSTGLSAILYPGTKGMHQELGKGFLQFRAFTRSMTITWVGGGRRLFQYCKGYRAFSCAVQGGAKNAVEYGEQITHCCWRSRR